MSIIQTFYDSLATQYDKLFLDWQSTIKEQHAYPDFFGGNYPDYTETPSKQGLKIYSDDEKTSVDFLERDDFT